MKRHSLHLSTLIACAAFASLADEAISPREYTAYHLAASIKVDGKLDDSAWLSLPAATGFMPLGNPEVFTQKQTMFRLGWDDEALYLAVKCEEPDIDKVKAEKTDADSLWSEDSIEIFLAPKYPEYAQLVVSERGSRTWVGGGLNWEAAAARADKVWQLEVRVPFRELGATPGDGAKWMFNIARNTTVLDSGGNRHTTWSPLLNGFHDIQRFSVLWFSSTALDRKQASVITIDMSKNSLSTLFELIDQCESEHARLLADYGKDIAPPILAQLKGTLETVRAARQEPSFENSAKTRQACKAMLADIWKLKLKLLTEDKAGK